MTRTGALPGKGIAVTQVDFDAVRGLIIESLRATSLAPVIDDMSESVGGGKMLRAGLTLKVGAASGTPRDTLLRAAAAIEMVHAASLLHDDVIDVGVLRRGAHSFWKKKSVSGAILLGDLMICRAMQMLDGVENGRLSGLLIRLAGEMCDAEAEQELVARATGKDWEKCVSLARRKTGSLFAFAAVAAGGPDDNRSEAFTEAGYRIGTAYQLADDIMDACGKSAGDGKALGSDARKEKLTSISASGGAVVQIRQCIQDYCTTSVTLLAPWPASQQAWKEYLQTNLSPVIQRFAGEGSP